MHYNHLLTVTLLNLFWSFPLLAMEEISQPFKCQPISFPEESKLCALLSMDVAQWFLLEDSKDSRLSRHLTATPQSLSIISDFQISPTQSFLAIVSVGEGHPFLDVVDLKNLIENDVVKSFLSINPHPGFINIKKWQKEQLIVVTDRLLTYSTLNEGEKGYPLSLSEEEEFALEIITGKITPLTPNAQNPIRFYSQQLSRSESFEVISAINALVSLQAVEVIPV